MIESVINYYKPELILNIGTNIGECYRECKNILPDAYYYLIEVNTECEEILSSLNVDFYSVTVSNSSKECNFSQKK